jgi:hypothetical protein
MKGNVATRHHLAGKSIPVTVLLESCSRHAADREPATLVVMATPVRLLLAAVLLGSGCIEHDLVDCGDGRVCPVGTTCDRVNASCVSDGAIGISAAEIELLDVQCGTTAMHTMLVTNPGSYDVAISARATPSHLTIEPAEATIAAGESLELTLILDAGTANSPGERNVGAVSIVTDRERLTRVVRYSMSGALVTASETVDLGETPSNGSEVRTFSVTNRGNVPTELTITNLGDPFSMPTPNPITIAPNTQRELVVEFDPGGVVGDYKATAQLAFSGTHCEPPPTTLAVSARASGDALLASNTLVEMAKSVCDGMEERFAIVLTSQSSSTQTITTNFIGANHGIKAEATGTLGPAPATTELALIRPGIVAPHAVGTFAALLEVTGVEQGTSNTVTKLIPVSFDVIAPVLVASVPALNVTNAETVAFSISNTGNGAGTVSMTQLTLELAEQYGFHVGPTEVDLAGGENLDVTVEFESPPGSGEYAENVSIAFDSPGQCGLPAEVKLTSP